MSFMREHKWLKAGRNHVSGFIHLFYYSSLGIAFKDLVPWENPTILQPFQTQIAAILFLAGISATYYAKELGLGSMVAVNIIQCLQ